MDDKDFIREMLGKGYSKDDIFAALDRAHGSSNAPNYEREPSVIQRGIDPRRNMSAMRPDTGGMRAEEGEGPQYDTNEAPFFRAMEGEAAARDAIEQSAHRANTGEGIPLRTDPIANDPLAQQVLANVAGAGAARVIAAAPGVANLLQGGRLARTAGGAITGAGSGATAAATAGATKRRDLLMAALLGAGGEALAQQAPAIRDPRTRTGRAIKRIEDVGGQVPGKGGMFDEPGYRALPDSDAGTAQMAADAESQIADSIAGRRAVAGERLGQVEEDVSRNLGRTPISTRGAQQSIRNARAAGEGGAGPTVPEADRELAAAAAQLEGQGTRASLTPSIVARIRAGGGPPNVNTFDELRNLQKGTNYRADTGSQVGDLGTAGAKQAAKAVRDAVRAVDPRMGPALDEYGNEMGQLSRADDLLYSSDQVVPPTRAAKQAAGVRKLTSAGSEARSSLPYEAQLDELASLDPIAALQIPRLRARNAAENLRFGPPSPGASFLPTLGRAATRNLDALNARLILPLAEGAQRSTPLLRLLEASLGLPGRERRTEP
jgi:hypothetical protein